MSMMPRVAIVVHRQDSFDKRVYWLRAIAERWRAAGMQVSVIKDPKARLEADLAVLHVDLTLIPADYLACVQSAPASVNGYVPDISKRVVSRHIVARGDSYDGPVMVKTDQNARGAREARLPRRDLLRSRRPPDIMRNCWGCISEAHRQVRRWRRHGSHKAFHNYPIFTSKEAVPEAVWDDEEYVVERFLPERRDGRYWVRTWLFFGDREQHGTFFSEHPIVKGANIRGHEPLVGDIPEELRQIRRELKFDFGKFDYTMVDGHPILFDANRTPTMGMLPRDRYLPIAQSLSEGIGAFLRQPAGVSSAGGTA